MYNRKPETYSNYIKAYYLNKTATRLWKSSLSFRFVCGFKRILQFPVVAHQMTMLAEMAADYLNSAF